MAGSISLGQKSEYPDTYSPELLEPIPRSLSRDALFGQAGGEKTLPFTGSDVWTAYELSWLDKRGKPIVMLAEFTFPFNSPSIIESKSFKYYLNSLNQTSYTSADEVKTLLTKDLSKACGASVEIEFYSLSNSFPIIDLPGKCIDDLDIDVKTYKTDATLLTLEEQERVDNECLYSHLLKSNCPVTGQPDWATLWIHYSGTKINKESLLAYLISYRGHQDFHENCVENIFNDLLKQCSPEKLSVYARYTRRGGLDINPFRTNCGDERPKARVARQ